MDVMAVLRAVSRLDGCFDKAESVFKVADCNHPISQGMARVVSNLQTVGFS